MDEQALIVSARTGNPHAFNALVSAYQGVAYNVAYRVIGHPEAAADATQDALLAAYRALPSFRGGSFRAWLLRIVTNVCYDRLRQNKRRPQVSLDEMAEDLDYVPGLAADGESPEDVVLRQDVQRILEMAIAKLPFDQRVAVVLSDVEGLSYEEIAAATGATVGTVKSRLSRARARLRDFLTQGREPLRP